LAPALEVVQNERILFEIYVLNPDSKELLTALPTKQQVEPNEAVRELNRALRRVKLCPERLQLRLGKCAIPGLLVFGK